MSDCKNHPDKSTTCNCGSAMSAEKPEPDGCRMNPRCHEVHYGKDCFGHALETEKPFARVEREGFGVGFHDFILVLGDDRLIVKGNAVVRNNEEVLLEVAGRINTIHTAAVSRAVEEAKKQEAANWSEDRSDAYKKIERLDEELKDAKRHRDEHIADKHRILREYKEKVQELKASKDKSVREAVEEALLKERVDADTRRFQENYESAHFMKEVMDEAVREAEANVRGEMMEHMRQEVGLAVSRVWEAIKPYLLHKVGCESEGGQSCDCGLDDLRIEHEKRS